MSYCFDRLFSNHVTSFKDSKIVLQEEGLIIQDGRYKDLIMDRIAFMNDYERKKYLNENLKSILLSNYHIANGQLDFFIKTGTGTNKLLTEVYGIEPIYKEGIQFNLFHNHKKENKKILAIEKSYLERYSALRKKYNRERDLIKANEERQDNEAILKMKRDSINKIVDSLEIQKTAEIDNYEKSNNENIFQKIKSLNIIKIDSIDYSDSLNCKYSTNQFNGVEGILCNLNDVNLPKGNKVIEFTRKSYNSRLKDSIRLTTIRIPVYIE